ncbi:MAG: hypothetical protein ACLFQP_12635 [Halothece sp.]
MVFWRDRAPQLISHDDILPVLEGIELELTPSQIFGWLKMGG